MYGITFKNGVHWAPYRAGWKARESDNFEFVKMLELKVVQPAETEWDVPIRFVLKREGLLWFCVDYRKSNAVTDRHAYPTARMDEFIAWFADPLIFSNLDAIGGYWQTKIEAADCDKTALTSHHNL